MSLDWDSDDYIQPYEQRDQEDEAEIYFNRPLRDQNRQLQEENLRLKTLLREKGISWSPSLILDASNRERGVWSDSAWPSAKKGTAQPRPTRTKGSRSSVRHERRLPSLPVEVQLRVLEYAMTSDFPIIDPLSKTNPRTITNEEKKRGNQIAIGFLSTCKAFHYEGTRFLWGNNSFVFTSHVALRNFSNVNLPFRQDIKHITMRIIARYYDDEDRDLYAPYPSEDRAGGRLKLPIIQRVKEASAARRGFRSYAWLQIVDFLDALRPPFDPVHAEGQSRPRLLPGLESLRMDLVNFPPDFLVSPGGPAIHNLASHDLASTLNELQITGISRGCQWAADLSSQLARMVKDDGLLLKNISTFVHSRFLRRNLKGDANEWRARVVRGWKVLAKEYAESKKNSSSNSTPHVHHFHHEHGGNVFLPPAPKEDGAPPTLWKTRRTLWKRVPMNRESQEREWVEFDRTTGSPIPRNSYDVDLDVYDEDDLICQHCGIMHSPYDEEF